MISQHDYTNDNMTRVLALVRNEQYRFMTEFLMAPVEGEKRQV